MKGRVFLGKKKNLLFIMTDQQRIDTINTIIDGKIVTPTINKLIAGGANFQSAYNSCPLCVPARTALATGINPVESGMMLNDLAGRLAREDVTLHERLYNAGYDIAHIGMHHIVTKPNIKEKLPFSYFYDEFDYEAYAKKQEMNISRPAEDSRTVYLDFPDGIRPHTYSNHRVSDWQYSLENFKDYVFASKAMEYIKQEHENPFALFVCLWAPHPPLVVPEPYASMFDPEKMQLPENVAKIPDREPTSRRQGAAAQLGEDISMEEWKKVWAAHMGLTRMCDDQLARIINTLKETNQLDDTLIVFTVDHGDALGQHTMYQKMEMYEQSVRVPAVFSGKDIVNKSFSNPISHLNFVPTILDLLDVECDYEFEMPSLAKCLTSGIESPNQPIFAYYCGNKDFCGPRRMVVYNGYKLVYDGSDEFELFLLDSDPLEMNNLANDPDYDAVKKNLYELLKAQAIKNDDPLAYIDF